MRDPSSYAQLTRDTRLPTNDVYIELRDMFTVPKWWSIGWNGFESRL